MNLVGKVALGAVVVAGSFGGAIFAMNMLSPTGSGRQPALVQIPPLQPLSRSSVIVTPVAIAHTAIRDTMERAAPKDLTGKRENVFAQVLQNAEIGWTIARGPLAVAGRAEGLAISTPLNGTFRATGQLAAQAGNITGAIGSLLGGNFAQGAQGLTEKTLDQRADVRGNVTITSRPALLSSWRIEPNLDGQVALSDASISVLGVRLNLANEIKPLVDRAVNEQIAALQLRVRNDPVVEVAARREWAKLCRSISLGAAGANMPNLWLEMRPTRAFAAQPRSDQSSMILTIGVQAETRIVPTETKPNCPFPAQLEVVPQVQHGRMNLAVPIDMPFTEVNRLLETQLKGKTFPADKSGAFAVNVRGVSLAASGDKLLISLRVKANETKSWLGLGAEATIYVWGRPSLDTERQMLRLTDISLDVELEAAFGILGAAARAAVPYLETALAEQAVVDLNPLMANARKSMETAIADFRKAGEGVRVDASVTALRLVGIAFDSTTLRVIAEADGNVHVAVTELPR